MINQAAVESFISFVELDHKISRLHKEEQEVRKKIAKNEVDQRGVTQEITQSYTVWHEMRKALDALELESKVLKESKRNKEIKLQRVSSPKEFISLDHEIKDIVQSLESLDEQGIGLLNSLETSEASYAAKKQHGENSIASLQHEKDALTRRLDEIDGLLSSFKEQRELNKIDIDEELLSKYVAMKERVENPVVPIIKNSCSGCFYAVSQPGLVSAERGELTTCADCYRLLYQLERKHA